MQVQLECATAAIYKFRIIIIIIKCLFVFFNLAKHSSDIISCYYLCVCVCCHSSAN